MATTVSAVSDETQLALLGQRLDHHETRLETLEAQATLIFKLKLQLNTLETQIKITWALLTLVASGLFGFAFAVLRGGIS